MDHEMFGEERALFEELVLKEMTFLDWCDTQSDVFLERFLQYDADLVTSILLNFWYHWTALLYVLTDFDTRPPS